MPISLLSGRIRRDDDARRTGPAGSPLTTVTTQRSTITTAAARHRSVGVAADRTVASMNTTPHPQPTILTVNSTEILHNILRRLATAE